MRVWEQLAKDQTDLWQVVPKQVFTPYSRLLISTAFVGVSRIGSLGVTSVSKRLTMFHQLSDVFSLP